MLIASSEQIETIRLVVNPEASWTKSRKRTARVQAQIGQLAGSAYGSRLLQRPEDRIQTHKDPVETAKRLDDKVGPNTLLLLIGGDGTGHNWTNASLLHAQSPYVRQAFGLMLGGGFADDGPGVLNSRQALRQPSAILDNGEIVSFRPIDWHFDDDQVLTNLYGTLGGSAAGALSINQPENRDASRLGKAWLVYRALQASPPFKMSENGGPVEEAFEFGLGNSTAMADFEGCFPYDLNDPRIFMYKFTVKQVMRSAVRFQRGNVPGQPLEGLWRAELSTPTIWQGDGEERKLAAGTQMTAQPAAEMMHLYSTLLSNEPAALPAAA